MRAEIIKIGNSMGLRIPKSVLEQCGMKTIVDLRVKDHSLIVTPCEEEREKREGWEENSKIMAKNKDDTLLDANSLSHPLDEDEWKW